MKKFIATIFCLSFVFLAISEVKASDGDGKQVGDTSKVYYFIKKELNTGFFFSGANEYMELSSDGSSANEKIFSGTPGFKLQNRVWNFLSYKQEYFNLYLDLGPFFGIGNWEESSSDAASDGNQNSLGLRAKLGIDYENRFYLDDKSYSLISIQAWGRNDLYFQNMEGQELDSTSNWTDFKIGNFDNEIRYGFQAKAGWGYGKLNPMNHYMIADHILSNSYPGRLFSVAEIKAVSDKISELKHKRDPYLKERSSEKELDELKAFINQKLLLTDPDFTEEDWELGEFLPRMDGSRVELGPSFSYYSYEPDFYYGGFVTYSLYKYVNSKWNRNLNFDFEYNSYKHYDWSTITADASWSYYPDLRTSYSFGLKYTPELIIYGLDDMEPLRHNFVPYVSFFKQVSPKTRFDFSFSWKIGNSKNYMVSGPELSLIIYQSRY